MKWLLVIAMLIGVISCSKPPEYAVVINGVVNERHCLLVTPSGVIPADTAGETLVKAYVGNQIGSIVGEVVGGKTGATVGGVVGALGGGQMVSCSTSSEVYCTYHITLDNGDEIQQIFHDDYIGTLDRHVSLIKHHAYGGWYLTSRITSRPEDTTPLGQHKVTY